MKHKGKLSSFDFKISGMYDYPAFFFKADVQPCFKNWTDCILWTFDTCIFH